MLMMTMMMMMILFFADSAASTVILRLGRALRRKLAERAPGHRADLRRDAQ